MTNKFSKLHSKMIDEIGGSREICSVNYSLNFVNYDTMMSEARRSAHEKCTPSMIIRRRDEEDYYNFLSSQLCLRLTELKGMTDINIFDTRKLVATSENCISLIHIMIRDKIHLNVYFRSSDVDGVLPLDLEFISKIPYTFNKHLDKFKQHKDYSDMHPKICEFLSQKEVQLNLTFGSLHRTN